MASNLKKGSPKTRRRTQEERRAETSAKLLKATIDLLLEKGFSKFRIADAAAKAKVSRGGQTHHFATKNELIEAAIERLFESEIGQAEVDAANTADGDLIDHSAQHARDFFSSKLYRVSLNMLISVGRSDHLVDGVRDIAARSRGPIEEVWVDRFIRSGVSKKKAEEILVLLWSVQRGFVVEHLIESNGRGGHGRELDFTVSLLSDYLHEERNDFTVCEDNSSSPVGIEN